MLRIEMLAAGNGDALWIEYGDPGAPGRVLVDGGQGAAFSLGLRPRIEQLPAGARNFELLVVTHVDADHIDGALDLLRDETLGATFGDVWFNGWRHLPDTPLEALGPVTGELLTDVLVSRSIPWNEAFDGGSIAVRPDEPLPVHTLPGGLELTVLSPSPVQLARLKPVWSEAVREAGLDPDAPRPGEPEEPPGDLERLGGTPSIPALAALPFKQDTAEPNGSSIALLVSYEGATALLSADAYPSVVQESIERLLPAGEDRLPVGAVKLPHHGSRANVSSELLARLDSRSFLVSSNGSRTRHPHPESVARAISSAGPGAELAFNYTTEYTEIWSDDTLRSEFSFETFYPPEGSSGLAVDVEPAG